MRLDYKREKELERRKGLTWRTVLIVIWIAMCVTGAYFLTNWLFEIEALTYNIFYGRLRLPPSIPKVAIRITVMFILTVAMQVFLMIGFSISSPLGRERPGRPSLRSREPDPDDKKFHYR